MSDSREHWINNVPLLGKMLAAFGLVFLCFLATSVVSYRTSGQDDAARRREGRQIEVIRHVEEAIQAVRLQQLAIRDYLLGDGEQALETVRVQRERRDRAMAEALEAGSALQNERLRRALAQAASWDAQVRDGLASAAVPQDAGADTLAASRRRLDAVSTGKGNALALTLGEIYNLEVNTLLGDRATMSDWIARAHRISLVLLVAGLLIIIGTLWMLSRLVVSPINRLTARMTRLADGDLDVDIDGLRRGDEIGAIARALDVFRRNSLASREANWVKLSVGEVGALLQQAQTAGDYAQALVSEIAPRIGAGIGVLFLWDEDAGELRLQGSYGFQRRKHLGLRYGLGDGLIGQAALERKRIGVQQVPDEFFGIHSALGEAQPRHLVAVPLLLKDRLLGVFEFGTFQPFTPSQEAFIEAVLPTVALGLDNIRRAGQTQLLLERTRAQAEELQQSQVALRAQEEELRATNEELQGKTVELEEQAQRLSASEEELRVQAEELQASNEELRQKTEVLNEQKDVLQALQRETEFKAQELARASQYKTDFLANMSHELRTPLNSLLILSKELAENESGHLDAEEVEAAAVIHDSGSNLLRLINDILDLSKIEAGKMDVHREEVRVDAITREVTRHFRHMAVDSRLEFAIDVDPQVPELLVTDRSKLQQILNNLLGNAFKFTREGKVTLRLCMADSALLTRIGAAADRAHVALAVQDTGIGIPAERLESIFDAFEQVDSSTSRHYGGSGLGLAIARRLAQLLDGHLVVDSEPGKGSTFALVLPLLAAPPRAADPASARAAPPAPPQPARAVAAPLIDWIPDDRHAIAAGESVILTIEDDPAFARILVDLIRRKGHRALAAADGESGLELARRYRPTGILLDVMLPGMDGWSVMQHLKHDPVTAAIPVHFISAVDEAAKGVALGAVGYLTKPVDRKALIAAFDHLLEVAGKIVRKLLLVDDDDDSRLALTRLLQADNVEIDQVASGEEALERIATHSYDCIVLDLNLGGISGIEFLEKAANLVAVPPVVIYSAQELSREESLKLRQYTDSIVIKGTRSTERLLDEVSLFLHSIGSRGASATPSDDTQLAGRKLLLVDDDMRNLFALSKSLRARGMNVVLAQDGYKALQQLRENNDIELVLMDIMMPGMDGYETTREIRRQPQWADLPIIAVTAKAMHGDRDKCLEAGANDYLTKPVDLDKLLSMIRVWLQK
ncbi:response regulator [Stenotrophomonas acidaminiphila]|uniref:hybrid sensor histidine kinase/response regulator n=1 Tax=Stenotrophomonas acidaminiphila TaxID=128780 RepID=UPI002ABE0A45|nr:response regulator [Stenotrophomonas acidaminiphila]WPU55967.1 response regulator [Stenotrophomonas acidaminiphila]